MNLIEPNAGPKLTRPHPNAGKLPVELFPLVCMIPAVRALEYGIKKYPENDWEKLTKQELIAKMIRHLMQAQDGQEINPESGVAHIGHVGALYSFYVRKFLLNEP